MTERTPLLNYRLVASVNESEPRSAPESRALEELPGSPRPRSSPKGQPKKLSVFFGVVIPTLLSMFSVVVFLRIGFVVGQAGLYQGILMFVVAYFIISMTVLSVCAISTNGALDAGGAYCILNNVIIHQYKIAICLVLSCILIEIKLLIDLYQGRILTNISNFLSFNLSHIYGNRVRNKGAAIIFNIMIMWVKPFTFYFCSVLLQRDYSFLRAINIWEPVVIIGVYSSTISASMSNLIGASRILYALAKDDLFGKVLCLAKKTSQSGNPWVAVLMSWFLVQLVLFSGKLNTIASIVTIFFLLVYAAVDLACLALEWASAPNFRPTFRYFTWHTCILGIIGCAIMMFLINPIYASASIAFMLLLLLLIHYLSPTSSWGYISQALIFHQVRKYLLMLDVRKDHIKFWRPQILLMVSNPRSSVGLITLINDLKKSGLYVLGHVQLGDLSTLPSDPLQAQYDSWLALVDHLNIKAFVNLTLADSVRHGVQHLLFISGLGGMRPNTLVLGFYDDCLPKDKLIESSMSSTESTDPFSPSQDLELPPLHRFASLRGSSDGQDYGEFGDGKVLGAQEYVSVISDAMKMLKNVVLARYFNDFDKARILSPPSILAKGNVFVDVWPVNLLRPDSCSYVDTCSLFLLQLACILNMVKAWRKATLRLFLCVEEGRSVRGPEAKLGQLLKDLRIKAQVKTVPWDQVVALHWQRQSGINKNLMSKSPDLTADEMEARAIEEESEEDYANSFPSNATRVSDDYLVAVNKLILDQAMPPPAVRFLYLPRPPADTRRYATYLHQLDLLTQDLGPTLLIHGVTPVITTDL
uniref:Solute carrier family 12 member 9 n=1 Tax=Xiphophorus couchianus TaxID=32473 RepID=A0A3B5L841_9TELE